MVESLLTVDVDEDDSPPGYERADLIVEDSPGQVWAVELEDGRWVPPGGHINPGETPAEAAVREFKEETGIPAQNPVLIGVIVEDWASSYVFKGTKAEGKRASPEEPTRVVAVEALAPSYAALLRTLP